VRAVIRDGSEGNLKGMGTFKNPTLLQVAVMGTLKLAIQIHDIFVQE